MGAALGGDRHRKADEQLLWRNAVAFMLRSQHQLAYSLASQLRDANDLEIRSRALALLDFYASQGLNVSGDLKNPWHGLAPQKALRAILLTVVPATLIAAFSIFDDSAASPSASEVPYQISAPTASSIPAVNTTEEAPVAVPTCARSVSNGAILTGRANLRKKGHEIHIDNGSAGDAIIKVRYANSNKTMASLFVRTGQSAVMRGVPDGTYVIQYAVGPTLAANCKSFSVIYGASQFPDIETLETSYSETPDGTLIERHRLSYTLYSTPTGNVRPISLDPRAFGQD